MKFTKIVLTKKDGPIIDFAKERNLALNITDGPWVFFVDSDEEISPELEKEIGETKEDRGCQGYRMRRIDHFWGRWLKHGETGNIRLVRLGKKGAGVWKRRVHEYWDIKNTGELKKPLLHHPVWSIGKINHYSDIDALEFGYFKYREVFLKPIGKFISNYFFKLGFLDGFPGFVHAYLMSFQSLIVRVKQYDLFQTS